MWQRRRENKATVGIERASFPRLLCHEGHHRPEAQLRLLCQFLDEPGRREAAGLCSFRMLDLLEQKKVDEPLEGTDCEPIVCPRLQRRQGCEGLPGVTPIIDFMSFVIRSIAVMACRSSLVVTTCGDSAGFSVVTTQGWM